MSGLADANILIDATITEFNIGMLRTGGFAWLRSVGPLNRMERDDRGKLYSSVGNTDAMQMTAQAMYNATVTDAYLNRVDGLKEPLSRIAQIIEDYYVNNIGDLIPVVKGKIPGIIKNAEREIDNMMGGSAVKSQIIDPTINALSSHINMHSTHNAMMKDMNIRVRERYDRFAGPRAADILQRFSRDMNDLMAINFNLSWIKYVGGLRENSREFCIQKNDNYYHVGEVRLWPRQEGPWEGMLPGTNKYTIFTNAGGYNCYHTFQYVKASEVPDSAKNRARRKGFI